MVIIFILFIGLLSFGILSQLDIQKSMGKTVGFLPNIHFLGLDSIEYSFPNAESDTIGLVLFKPECGYCENQLKALSKDSQLVSDVPMVLYPSRSGLGVNGISLYCLKVQGQ